MNDMKEKILQTNFVRLLKRLLLLALCVGLLGGGSSAFLLRTQIGEAVSYVQDTHFWDEGAGEDRNTEPHRGEWLEPEAVVTPPSVPAIAAVSITGLLCALLALAFWLLVALWLYQAAILAKMNGSLWLLLGLVGSVGTVFLFILVRSLTRKKCDACGEYQPAKAQYCAKCGAALFVKCPVCGTAHKKVDLFCQSCGSPLAPK